MWVLAWNQIETAKKILETNRRLKITSYDLGKCWPWLFAFYSCKFPQPTNDSFPSSESTEVRMLLLSDRKIGIKLLEGHSNVHFCGQATSYDQSALLLWIYSRKHSCVSVGTTRRSSQDLEIAQVLLHSVNTRQQMLPCSGLASGGSSLKSSALLCMEAGCKQLLPSTSLEQILSSTELPKDELVAGWFKSVLDLTSTTRTNETIWQPQEMSLPSVSLETAYHKWQWWVRLHVQLLSNRIKFTIFLMKTTAGQSESFFMSLLQPY